MVGVWTFLQWSFIVVYFILCCFMKLSFSNNLNRNTIKILTQSMDCSFCIWIFLTRNNKNWTPYATNFKVKDTSKEICKSPSLMSSLKQTTKPVWNAESIFHVCFINKTNTCYANSILESLRWYQGKNPFYKKKSELKKMLLHNDIF